MSGMRFEWDARKGLANRRKHRIEFTEALTVFSDPLSITISDPDSTVEEDRLVTVGMSGTRRILVVVHTERGERTRLISARTATKHERIKYQENTI